MNEPQLTPEQEKEGERLAKQAADSFEALLSWAKQNKAHVAHLMKLLKPVRDLLQKSHNEAHK